MCGSKMVGSGEFKVSRKEVFFECSVTRTWMVLQRCFAVCGFDFIGRRSFLDSENLIWIDERGIIFIEQLLISGRHGGFLIVG
jgi:hypothetical protein